MDPTEQFRQLLEVNGTEVPLDQAALLIAAHVTEGLDVAAVLQRLQSIAGELRDGSLDGLLHLVFEEMGYRGDTTDYYDPRNSLLDQVIERRVGNPITLSILLISLGQRCGVALTPVGMPGHFLVGIEGTEDRFVDAFDAGSTLDLAGCQDLLWKLGHRARFDPSYVAPTRNDLVIARMLNNLVATYAQRKEMAALAWSGVLRSYLPGDRVTGPQLADQIGAAGYWDAAATILDNTANQLETEGLEDELDSDRPWRASVVKLRARSNRFLARLN